MARAEPLSRSRIVDATIRLIEDEGTDAVTMRRLAAELDTAPASIYRHVENREELLKLAGEAILVRIQIETSPSQSWQERTISWADATRRALRGHRGWVALLVGPSTPAAESFPLFEAGVRGYVADGFPPEVAHAAAQAVVFVVLSFVDLESQWPDALEVTPGSLIADRTAAGVGDESTNDEMFDFLVAGVIAMVERRLANHS